jgi:hypothetical protein
MTSTPLGTSLTSPGSPSSDYVGAQSAGAGADAVPRTGWFTPAALACAAIALGLALQINFGQYHPAARPWLAAAVLACAAAVVLPNFGRLTILNWRPDQLVLAVGLAVQFALLYSRDPAATLHLDAPDDLAPFKAGIALAAALTAVGCSGTRAARFAVPMLLLTHLALGLWVIRSTPMPRVDVQVFQRDAAAALLAGTNPYAITFPDIYGGKLPVYGPGVAEDGRLNFGYPYLPLSLLLAVPGHLLGDFRYASLLALTLSGGLIAYARPAAREKDTSGPAGDKPPRRQRRDPNLLVPALPGTQSSVWAATARSVAAAALLLFTPRGFFVVEAGWTEPFAILFLAATVFVAGRKGMRWAALLPVALGLLLACKQYVVLLAPLVLLLPAGLPASLPGVRRMNARGAMLLALGLLVAAAVSLPLALWDVDAFLHSAVTLQFRQPFRADALSYLVPYAASHGGGLPPVWTSFAFAGAAALLALWRCPRTPAGFAAGVAILFLAFFATSKQAFCNYYALVLAALCCALAATPGVPCAKPRRP